MADQAFPERKRRDAKPDRYPLDYAVRMHRDYCFYAVHASLITAMQIPEACRLGEFGWWGIYRVAAGVVGDHGGKILHD